MADYEKGQSSAPMMAEKAQWDTGGKFPDSVDRAIVMGSAEGYPAPIEEGPEPHCKWYHAGIHVVTVIVGTGVLGLPGAMSQLTWVPGLLLLGVAFCGSYYCACLLGFMHHTKEPEGAGRKRLTTYFSIGEYAFGRKRAELLVVPFQLVVLTGTCIAYLIASSTNINDMYRSLCEDCTNLRLLVWTTGYAAMHLILCFFPSLESVTGISILASIASIGYCVISVTLCFYVGKQPGVVYGMADISTAAKIFNIFTGLSTMAFAFGVHMMIPEIQATLRPYPSPEKEFVKGISVAWVLVFILYFGSAISGYWAFGNDVKSNILSSIVSVDNSTLVKTFVYIAEILVVIHVVIAYQVLAQPVYATLERACLRTWPGLKDKNPYYVRIPVRFLFIGCTYFVAILIPFFGTIMALFGALGMTPLTFILPAAAYIFYKGEDLRPIPKVFCWLIVCVGSFVGVFGTIAAVRQITLDADTFEVFS